jgi:cytidine deaminase
MEADSLTPFQALAPDERSLLEAARDAARRGRSDYYRFKVGAAVLCDEGHIFAGQNIEYSNGAVDHAEEGALQAAANAGAERILKVAVAGYSLDADDGEPALPCGACLQRLSDWGRWGGTQIVVLAANGSLSKIKRRFVGDLLPEAFGPRMMRGS